MRKRQQLDMMTEILQLCVNPKRQFEVIRELNLSYLGYNKHLTTLLLLKLIERIDAPKVNLNHRDYWASKPNNSLVITEKGKRFIELLRQRHV